MDACGNVAGVQRLEEEEKKKEENSATGNQQEVAGGSRGSVSGQTESRADDFATIGLCNESLRGQILWEDWPPVAVRAGAHCDV